MQSVRYKQDFPHISVTDKRRLIQMFYYYLFSLLLNGDHEIIIINKDATFTVDDLFKQEKYF